MFVPSPPTPPPLLTTITTFSPDKTNICVELRSVSGYYIQVGRITMPTDK